jgi:hypothetical protein
MMRKTVSVVLTSCLAFLSLTTSLGAARQNAAASSPKADALKLYTIIKNEDWKGLFFIVKFSAKVQADMPTDPDVFAKGMADGIRESDPDGVTDKLFKSISDITVGEPVVNGNNADVPTAANLTINGKVFRFKGTAHLVQDKNVWKWDLTFTDDAQQATSQGIQTLLGKPDPQ